jgi:hypothetical protein
MHTHLKLVQDITDCLGTEAKVKEKARDESQDGSLISVMPRLAVIEHTLESRRRALCAVNGM